ncbi:Gfo/Idh/MocA family protein [Paenibacillus sp. GCM10027626]|uniref:Gfo/Idh/MocA family protein n=1 Tax=Paenibacillus sp. GCM10027626 TaxID=3273411 RepID=UPI003630A7F9
MKVAVIGCGGMGHAHALSYAEMPGVELVGVCDMVPEMAQALAERAGTRAFTSLEEMNAQVNPDLVSVTVPSFLHKGVVKQLAEAGKHIVCEKPIALTVADAEEMQQICEANNVRLFVGHVVRFFPEYAQAKQQVSEGLIGNVGVIHAKRAGSHPGDTKAWFKDMDKSGGVIVDLMIHDIDYARWIAGEVKSVYALGKCDDNMDYALVTLIFENGAVANLESYWGYPGSFHSKAEIAGSKGIISLDSLKSSSLQIRKQQTEAEARQFVEIPQSPTHLSPTYRELEHFVSCVRNNSEPLITVQDACKALEIANAAVESIRTGKAVML